MAAALGGAPWQQFSSAVAAALRDALAAATARPPAPSSGAAALPRHGPCESVVGRDCHRPPAKRAWPPPRALGPGVKGRLAQHWRRLARATWAKRQWVDHQQWGQGWRAEAVAEPAPQLTLDWQAQPEKGCFWFWLLVFLCTRPGLCFFFFQPVGAAFPFCRGFVSFFFANRVLGARGAASLSAAACGAPARGT